MKYLLGIDPGQVSGWALLTVEASPKLTGTGKVDFTRPLPWDKGEPKMVRSCNEVLDEIEDQLFSGISPGHLSGEIMAIEGQYLDESKRQDSRRNIDSLIKLCRNAGRWAEAAAYQGLRVYWVPPITWITKEIGKGLRREQIEKMAKEKVDALYGKEKRSEHENAAVLIGRYQAAQIFWDGK